MAAGSNSIVEDWLRSVDLVQYTQSFLDNGYDDLEVCKQIGEDDLDAIGVPRDEHREKLLRAVRVLREEGGTAVYFTLEECDTCQSGDETDVGEVLHEEDLLCLPPSCGNGSRRLKGGGAVRLDAYDMGKTTLVTYPKVQLKLILRDKLVEDNIDLAGPPFTTSDLSVCGSSLTALAIRFAEELKTHFIDVLERLEELWIVARNNENFCSQTLCRSPARGVYGGTQSLHYGYHPQYYQHIYPYPGSPRNQPPPLPSCPPPPTMSSTYLDRCNSLQSHLDGGHIRVDPTAHQNYVALDGGVCCLFSRKIIREPGAGSHEDKKKSGSVFGRFLRNIGFRRSNRKGTYKQHQGDLNAYEISMSDEDRMALMILVKEGKISTQTALAVVQKFEEERRAVTRTVSEEGKENVCHDTPSKKGLSKKKKAGKPTKSQSTLSADDPQRCDACPSKSPADEHMSCDHQICRQRRVHSLGQLDVPHLRPQIEPQLEHHMERVPLTRAVSCSPACPQNQKMIYPVDQASLVSRLHSPGHQLPQQAQTNHHHHHHHQNLNKVDALRERLTGKTINVVPKTSSKTSLLSSGSDQSMETGTQTPLRTDPMSRRGTDSVTYNSNSTVSMSSDNNSPGLSRKKSGPMLDPRVKSHRSASCSTGDDGISSENDDNDSNSKRQETGKVKNSMNNTKLTRIRDGGVSRPPLLRQLSAPVGAANLPGPYLGQAKVIVDYTPTAEEEDFVHLKKGEVVYIINMAQSGVWLGVVNGKRGKFRFEHVEVVAEPDKTSASSLLLSGQKDIPKSVEDLLQRIGLGHLANAFLLNGYDDLDIFSELDGHDLDTLHITDQDQRTKLLSAARVLVDWHEQFGAQTPTLTNMDSPSSRAGNSSCDSGCYASGEGTKHHSRRRNEGGHKKAEDGAQVHKPHTPCRSCGKPKQPRKYSNPVNSAAHYMPGQYPSIHSPYSPGHFQYAGHQQQLGPYTPGYYGYHTSGHHGHRHVMSGSRTLTELNAADTQNVPVKLETFASGKQISVRASPVQSAVGMMPVSYSDKKPTVGDRVSLTEEDKEVISITCGNNQTRKLSTPIQTLTSGSSQLEINNSSQCSGCVPMTGCPQCDESYICESASCVQCVTYASCPQCFPYRHYVNTTMRSDSKSSKMSCSSTCTQTTCLSPDHDDSSHSGGSNLIDYSSISSPLGYPMSKASPNRAQPFYYYQQQYTQPAFGHAIVHLTGRATTPSQLPSPAPVPKGLPTAPPLTLALAESSLAQGVALTLQADAQPLPLAQPDWSKQPDNAEEAPGMATLYSRGRSQTPEKSEKSGGQLKSPTRSLMPLVSTKLSAEIIDLTQSPYSSAIGHCGIPPLLVQRYSEELRQDMETMSLVIEQLRETQLRAQGRPCIQNESLSESCKLACDLQISSVQNFLISIGLPMYFKPLTDNGVTTLDQMLKLKDGELEKITGADSRHLKRISHALEWVQHKLGSPNHKPHATGVTDKV